MAIYIFNYFASSIIRYTDGWLSKQNIFYVCFSKTFYVYSITSKLSLLSWKAHDVDAIVVSTNTHSIGSDCHWLFISGHEKITSDYR